MYSRAVIIASSLILVASTGSAFAADIYAPSVGGLKDPVIEEEVLIPEASSYREFSNWFIRGDVGVGTFSKIDGNGDAGGTAIAAKGIDFDGFFSGSIGFGKYVNKNVRLGLDLDYRHDVSSRYDAGNPATVPELTNVGVVPLEISSTSIMFNAVYDFAPQRRYSPYLGAGVGWAFHSLSVKGGNYTNNLNGGPVETGNVASSSDRSNSFTANVVAGLSVNLSQGLFLDMGYKFSYLGDASVSTTVSHVNLATAKALNIGLNDMTTHEFKIGLRYDLY